MDYPHFPDYGIDIILVICYYAQGRSYYPSWTPGEFYFFIKDVVSVYGCLDYYDYSIWILVIACIHYSTLMLT